MKLMKGQGEFGMSLIRGKATKFNEVKLSKKKWNEVK